MTEELTQNRNEKDKIGGLVALKKEFASHRENQIEENGLNIEHIYVDLDDNSQNLADEEPESSECDDVPNCMSKKGAI